MKAEGVVQLAALLVTVALASAVFADRLPGEYYNELHLGYETPHTPWAKPLAGGQVRAFFIAPTHAAREVAELAQRLDMQVGGRDWQSNTAGSELRSWQSIKSGSGGGRWAGTAGALW